jgi:hypothetical protein
MPDGDKLDKSGVRNDGTIPAGWTDERFKVVDGGDGTVGLWNPRYKRFVRMPDGDKLDKSGVRNDGTMPAGWDQERFKTVCLSGCRGCPDSDMRYNMKCIQTDPVTSMSEKSTGCSHMRGQNLQSLDRHNLKCAHNEVMVSFKLQHCSGNDWKYTYKCAKISDSSLPRKEVTTGCNVAADHKIEYLDRQNVNCPKNYAMNGFLFTRDGCSGNQMRYKFTCIYQAN